jgi:hypothetical protein
MEVGTADRGQGDLDDRVTLSFDFRVGDSVDAHIALLLRQAGFETEVALDGATAIEIARRFRPAVILLDIALPGMNGYSSPIAFCGFYRTYKCSRSVQYVPHREDENTT